MLDWVNIENKINFTFYSCVIIEEDAKNRFSRTWHQKIDMKSRNICFISCNMYKYL